MEVFCAGCKHQVRWTILQQKKIVYYDPKLTSLFVFSTDRRESYYPPQILTWLDGEQFVLFGTGGNSRWKKNIRHMTMVVWDKCFLTCPEMCLQNFKMNINKLSFVNKQSLFQNHQFCVQISSIDFVTEVLYGNSSIFCLASFVDVWNG